MSHHAADRRPDTGHAVSAEAEMSALDAAATLGVSERTIRRAIARGELVAVKHAGVYRITPNDLAQYGGLRERPIALASRRTAHLARLVPFSGRAQILTSHHLPRPTTALIGREREIRQVGTLLDRGNVRLMTLIGPAGVGKTRLALELAAALEGDFAHGVRFVPLASVRDPTIVISVIANRLGIREQGDRPIADVIIDVLRDQHVLLVLDNLEHVVTVISPWLTDLLWNTRRLRVLTTSRFPLGVDGEQRFPLHPLPVPPETDDSGAIDNPAVMLFTQRAEAIQPDLLSNGSRIATVARICQRLDGLPLALELAAARVSMLSVDDLLDRLTDRFGILTSGAPTADGRSRSLWDAVAWSYDLLPEPAQHLLRRLSVFTGGFTLDAAEFVATYPGTDADAATLDTLATLVDHSLVRHTPSVEGESRYWMLETIREFGLDRLAASDHGDLAREAHAAYFEHLAAEAEPLLEGPDQVRWLDRIAAEHNNLRATTAWLVEQGALDRAVMLNVHLQRFVIVRGHQIEASNLFQGLLDQPGLEAGSVAHAHALIMLGATRGLRGEPTVALPMVKEALAIFREHDTHQAAKALHIVAITHNMVGDLEAATRIWYECVDLARDVGDVRTEGIALSCIGALALQAGDVDRAETLMDESKRIVEETGDLWLIGMASQDLAGVAIFRRQYDRAEALLNDGLAILASLGDHLSLPWLHAQLARACRARQSPDEAAAHLETSLAMLQASGYANTIPYVLCEMAALAVDSHDLPRCLGLLRQSIELFDRTSQVHGLPFGLDGFATLALAAGDLAASTQFLGAADRIMEQVGTVRTAADMQLETWERLTVTLREQMGSDAYAREWGTGHEWTSDQAVAGALAYELPRGHQVSRDPPRAVPLPNGLTRREVDVLQLLADGRTDREIGEALFISHRTAATHVRHIYDKIDVSSRAAATAFAIRQGLV